jgi:hypothetical protein
METAVKQKLIEEVYKNRGNKSIYLICSELGLSKKQAETTVPFILAELAIKIVQESQQVKKMNELTRDDIIKKVSLTIVKLEEQIDRELKTGNTVQAVYCIRAMAPFVERISKLEGMDRQQDPNDNGENDLDLTLLTEEELKEYLRLVKKMRSGKEK